jgi:uncharacterized integral membrane protein
MSFPANVVAQGCPAHMGGRIVETGPIPGPVFYRWRGAREAEAAMTEPTVPGRPRPHEEPPATAPKSRQARDATRLTRVSAAWLATAAALVLLVLLIVFILQNSIQVKVRFLGFAGSIPLGMALLIAAVGGGVLVAIAGTTRITQLRRTARRNKAALP